MKDSTATAQKHSAAWSRADWAGAYQRIGFQLCAIPPGAKHPPPNETDWPNRPRAVDHWRRKPEDGMGGILHLSGLASFDADALPESRALLAELGIDLDALTADAPHVQGNPARARWLWRVPAGVELKTHKLNWPDPSGECHPNGKPCLITVFELRAGSVQDVLPPSIHPGTGQPYQWIRSPFEMEQIPELPPALLELWRNWEAWLPELRRLCPWAPKAEPAAAPRPPGSSVGIIAAYNAQADIGALLEAHGYKRRTKDRWLAPDSATKIPGVKLLDSGKVYSHHGSDVLATGHAHDAFSVFTLLEHGGDAKAAAKAAARLLGMEPRADSFGDDIAERLRADPEAGQTEPEQDEAATDQEQPEQAGVSTGACPRPATGTAAAAMAGGRLAAARVSDSDVRRPGERKKPDRD